MSTATASVGELLREAVREPLDGASFGCWRALRTCDRVHASLSPHVGIALLTSWVLGAEASDLNLALLLLLHRRVHGLRLDELLQGGRGQGC